MIRSRIVCSLLVLLVLSLPLTAAALTEPKTETEYPDEIVVEGPDGPVTLRATGVGLREKTFMKVDVYTIVSYVPADATLGEEPGAAVRTLDAPKRIQMDLRRSFSRQKLVDSFEKVIDKNYDDTSAFADDMEAFLAGFERDAEDGDCLIFEYVPGTGLTTLLNGETRSVVPNPAFMEALWTVWFGDKPADDGMKRDLLSALDS